MNQLRAFMLLISLATGTLLFAQRDAPGWHYGAQAGTLLLPFKAPSPRPGSGAEVGAFVSYRLNEHEVQFQLTTGSLKNLSLQLLNKDVFVGPEMVVEKSTLVSISSFSFIDMNLLISPKQLRYKGFALAGGIKLAYVTKNNGLERKSERTTFFLQRTGVDENGLRDFESLFSGGGGGAGSLNGPAFSIPSNEWIPGLLLRVDKRFVSGPVLFLQAAFDLKPRFAGTAEDLKRSLAIYQLGFQYAIK